MSKRRALLVLVLILRNTPISIRKYGGPAVWLMFVEVFDYLPLAASIDGNISFDAMGNPVSVNIAFFDVCSGCALGTSELQGTGFDTWDDAGATSWLTTTSPIEGGTEFTIRFAIWDTGDAAWDSTVLIDNFRWIADGGTVDVGTTPAG